MSPGPRPAATREAVLDAATTAVLAGEVLDVRALAAATGVGRTTLYRWFGDRTGLLGAVLLELGDRAWAQARRDATGAGPDHALEVVRRFLLTISRSSVSAGLLAGEPRGAVVALMSPTAPTQRRMVARMLQLLVEHTDLAPGDAREAAEVSTQVAMTYVWASALADREPDVETPVRICARLLG